MRQKEATGLGMLILWFSILFLSGPFLSCFAFSQETKKDASERSITVSPEYTGVVVPQGQKVSVDLVIRNHGKRDENVRLSITSIPPGWSARIKTYNYGVTGVYVKADKSRTLTFRAEPDKDVRPGSYRFGIKAQTQDGRLSAATDVAIKVEGKREEKKPKGVKILTSYPVLRGPTDAKFEFSLEVDNKLDKDAVFNLTAKGPKNWEINFKPAYEEKFISSLRVKANQSQSVAVEVKPFILAEPGPYVISVKASTPGAKVEAPLKVVLIGTYKLEVGTASGLLSLTALQGKKANVSFYIKNSGSAPLTNVKFLSLKPENWQVDFRPPKIDTLAPRQLKQVEISVTPAAQALVGDYSIGLHADAGRVSKDMEMRVTVKSSTAWGWIGLGIIVLVVAGLVGLFIRLGRR